jgi:hypothetical protein
MRKIPYMILSTAIIAGLLASCGIEKTTNGSAPKAPAGEEITVPTDTILGEAQYTEQNGSIKINYTAKNISSQTLDFLFQSGMKVDYILYDSEGNEIDQYSKNALSTMALEEVALKTKETISQEFMIENLPNGTYSIEVFLNEPEQNAKAVLPFEVKSSIYNIGIGTLTGRVDLNSIEVEMDGSPRVFQLTDFAKEQLISIDDNTGIDFIYTETGIEQPTIEKLITQPTQIHIEASVLELDSELVGVHDWIRQNKNLEAMAGYQPFEAFRLYMYTKAGEDFETLYYFHNIDEDNLPVAKYVAENRMDTAIAQNREFMKKLNEVHDFHLEMINSTRANIGFTLPGSEEVLEFKMMKGEDNIWRALWLPLQ